MPQGPNAGDYLPELRDALRRLNMTDPRRRRQFLSGIGTRFRVGLRLANPRLHDELVLAHLDAFDAAVKAIEQEDMRAQAGPRYQ